MNSTARRRTRKELSQAMRFSARDFMLGVKPLLEERLESKVYPVEDKNHPLFREFDFRGIDAFYWKEAQSMFGIGSRMNYRRDTAEDAEFTFRYARWDERQGDWDYHREWYLKSRASTSPEEFALFPKLHIESQSKAKGSGQITWSFVAKTSDLVRYIYENFEDKSRVRIFKPKSGELRQVISVGVRDFADSGKWIRQLA